MRKAIVLSGIALAAAVSVLVGWPSQAPAQFTAEQLERNAKLTPALRKLILAYENYIHHFPTDSQVTAYLFDEAGRFRDAGDNETAITVFRRVLIRPELKRTDRAEAYEQIMACYQSLGQFETQEEWAHRMAVADVGREKQQAAKEFIFRAGHNRAKTLEDSGRWADAGEAYERLSVKNPDHDQSPGAMLIAAGLYERAEDKARAARTYERFYYTYPDYKDPQTGKGAILALENAAALYSEMEDYRHSADAAERILAAAPDHPGRQAFMNTLAAIYELLKDYNNAIRVRQQYIASYPRDPKSGGYQWDIAEFRGLAGQRQQQLAEYEAFIRSYPGDVRAVEANYIIGEQRLREQIKALDKGTTPDTERLLLAARSSFERAYGLHDSLEKEKPGAGDLQHAIGSIVEVAKMDSANYYSIALTRAQSFSQDSSRKRDALQRTEAIYRKAANYGYPPTTFESLYKRGRLFEDFANEYLKQPRPDTAITYDQILKVFFINSVSQAVLEQLAIPAYQKQMLDLYEQNRAVIDTAAFTIPDTSLRRMHYYWMEEARRRLATIPQKLDSLTLNTIRYEADVIVLDAQVQIPKKFEENWTTFSRTKQDLFRNDPKLVFTGKQQFFDLYVSPFVYGKGPTDTTAVVTRFQQIIAEGQRLGADTTWVLYNRGRLRLVFAARSGYFHQVADDGVPGLSVQVDTLSRRSNVLAAIVARFPKVDLSALGQPPQRPDLTPPTSPTQPQGDLRAMYANVQTRPIVVKYLEDIKAYKAAVANLQWRISRFRRQTEEFARRREALMQQFSDQFRDIVAEARRETQTFANHARDTQIYRLTIEQVVDRTFDAFERDIAFGDSVGYSEKDKYAVRDTALTAAFHLAKQMDSLHQDVFEIRQNYEAQRDTAGGGEGSPAFSFYNQLVTSYAAIADSFKNATIRRYAYVYNGRDSLFGAGLEHPTIVAAIRRLKQLDPTFGVQTVPLAFTFVTEDSTGLWRVSTTIDRDRRDAWKEMAYNDSLWLPAVKGTMRKFGIAEAAPGDTLTGAPQDTATAVAPDTALASAPADTARQEVALQAGKFLITGFPENNLNMTDLWSPTYADTVFFRYRLELPPRWSELPDTLRAPEQPRPVVRRVTITITADDDYVLYVNGEVTTAVDQAGRTDWKEARTYEILKDQWFVGDTVNIVAVRASNEKRVARVPDTDTTSYGLMARIDVQMDVPYSIYEILYKPPEPEPAFVLAFPPEDSAKLLDTTRTYFLTELERQQWKECRERELVAAWKDTVLIPWRLSRAQAKLADIDTQIVRLKRFIAEKQEEARVRIAQAAGAAVGVEEGPSPAPEEGMDLGVPEEGAPTGDSTAPGTPETPEQGGAEPERGRR